MKKINWPKYLACLILSSVFASVGNYISTTKSGAPVTPIEAAPGLLIFFLITVVGLFIWDLVNKAVGDKNLPAIAYISLLAIIASLPGVPGSSFVVASCGKIGLLPLCTPILSYAGISIGKDLDTFKQQGAAIVCVTLFAFIGTFIGSALIAQIVLKIQGVI